MTRRAWRETLAGMQIVALLGVAFQTSGTSGCAGQRGCSSGASSTAGETEAAQQVLVTRITTELSAFDQRGEPLRLNVALDEITNQALASTKTLRLAPEADQGQNRARLRLSARLAPDGFSGVLHALVSARVSETGTIPLSADLDAVRAGAPDGGVLSQEAYVTHLKKAVGDTVEALDQQARLIFSGNESLIAALGHPEADVRIMAARVLGERRARESVAPLCELLQQESGLVGEAVVGALAAIGEEAGAPCLIQWAGSDSRRLVTVLAPLASLGGEEAQSFLEMVASGHQEPLVRRAAEEALRRMGSPSS